MNPLGLMSKKEYNFYMLIFDGKYKKSIQNGDFNECKDYLYTVLWERIRGLTPHPRGWEDVLNR